MSELQVLRAQILQLRTENERLKRELESAYEKINLLELKNPIQLLTPLSNNDESSFVCMKRIIPHDGNENVITPHESKKTGKKTSI